MRAHFDSSALLAQLQRSYDLICDPPSRRAALAIHLLAAHTRVQLCWVPGHCGLPGNEAADLVAKEFTPHPTEPPRTSQAIYPSSNVASTSQAIYPLSNGASTSQAIYPSSN